MTGRARSPLLALALTLAAPGPASLSLPAPASLSRAPWTSALHADQRRGDTRLENRMLRQAAAQQARGDLAEAESTLRELLALEPGSSSAVLVLARVLRADERVRDVLLVADEFLVRNPASAPVRGLKLTVLAEVDSLSAIEPAVKAWIAADPASVDAYLEGSRTLNAALGSDPAAELLLDGVASHGELPRLLIELGDVHRDAGRTRDAAEAWARALGRDRAGGSAVFRRIEGLDEGRAEAAELLVARLGAEPTTAPRLETGAELALREGLEDDAARLAQAALDRLDAREARGFLSAFARKAEDHEMDASALWAYARLRDMTDDPAEARAADERLAAAALAAGDTASALAALQRITESHPRESSERQAAWTEQLRLQAAIAVQAEAEATLASLSAFAEEFPASPDLDALSASLASRLLGLGLREEAMEVLSGIEGPGAAIERAFLLLEGGALPDGIAALQASLPELEPAEATEMLDLTLALSELGPLGAGLAAEVAIARRRGLAEAAVRAVSEQADTIPAPDRPTVLAMAARAADDGGLADEAAALRRRIVAEHPDAREFPEAALRLADAVAAEPDGRDEAVRILEALIVGRPDSPVVPGARRALRRLQEGSRR